MQDKVLSLLGIATKAGKVTSGEFSVEKAVKSYKAHLVIVALDASDNTKKMFTNMCAFYEVPICFYSNKEALGNAIGKLTRASVAVLDDGFAKSLVKKMNL